MYFGNYDDVVCRRTELHLCCVVLRKKLFDHNAETDDKR